MDRMTVLGVVVGMLIASCGSAQASRWVPRVSMVAKASRRVKLEQAGRARTIWDCSAEAVAQWSDARHTAAKTRAGYRAELVPRAAGFPCADKALCAWEHSERAAAIERLGAQP